MLVSTRGRTQTHISESKVPADQAGVRLPPRASVSSYVPLPRKRETQGLRPHRAPHPAGVEGGAILVATAPGA